MKIVNNTGIDLKELENKISEFYPYSKKTLGFDRDPNSINLVSDPKNASNILGKTAFYNPGDASITVYTDKRHPKDILRSISHELVHHAQNCRGEFSEIQELEQDYAQTNKKLREMEQEAYLMGNMTFRDWEDGMKKEIDEGYRGEDGVGNRNLKYETAGVKKLSRKQRRLQRKIPGWEAPPEHIKDIGTAHKMIVQFKDVMLPEERELLEKLREKEHNGTFDMNDNWKIGYLMRLFVKRRQNMKKEVDEAYADGPAVDDRRLRYKTAGVKKQRSNSSPSKLSTTAPSKDTKPRKDNKAQNAIRQFGKIMTPEELKFAKKLQDKEDNNNGKLDKNDDQELYFMIVKLLKRQRGLREEESLEKPKQQGTDSKTMNEYNKKKIKEMMNSIITKIKQDLAEAEEPKPDWLDLDQDGNKNEPMSKAADEKKDDGEEKSDKDLSKVPPQLRKHVAKKMDESETVEESSCGSDHKREDDELDEGCCRKCGQSDCGCGNKMYEGDCGECGQSGCGCGNKMYEGGCGECGKPDCDSCGGGMGRMYEEDEGMEGFLSERRNNLFGKLVNEWFSTEKK